MSPNTKPCTARGPNFLVILTPVQGAKGCGAFQRSWPTGGLAKGMPR